MGDEDNNRDRLVVAAVILFVLAAAALAIAFVISSNFSHFPAAPGNQSRF